MNGGGGRPEMAGEVNEIVFRKRYLSLFTLSLACVLVALDAAIAIRTEVPKRLVYLPIASAFGYALWLLGWHSGVRIRADEVIVDNLAMRYRIPWNVFAGFIVDEGLGVRLKNHQVIGSVTFGGSVIGNVLGYRYTKRVRDEIEAARITMVESAYGTAAAVPRGKYRTEICLPVVPFVSITGFFVAVLLLSLLR